MTRTPEFPISPIFVHRWSPRAMSGEPLTQSAVASLLEAARFAPSASNVQPWRVVCALAGTSLFDAVFQGLVPANQTWCVRAGALLVWMSRRELDNGQPFRSHAFDAGAAWMSLALQGSQDGLVVHAMLGIDEAKVRAAVAAPAGFDVQCVIALGHPGALDQLSESQRARENPSPRKPQSEWAVFGAWPEGRT
jgi:nitroreductase